MEDQPSDNTEVLDAITQQKTIIDSYIATKKESEATPSVIPATLPEKPDVLSKKDFLYAIDELKEEKEKNTEDKLPKVNQPLNSEDNQEKQSDELTEVQEAELRKEFPFLDLDNDPLATNEDQERFNDFKNRLYKDVKQQEKNESIGKLSPIIENTDSPKSLIDSKENKILDSEELNQQLKATTDNLPESPPTVPSQSVMQSKALEQENLKPQTPQLRNNILETPSKIILQNKNIVSSELPEQQTVLSEPSSINPSAATSNTPSPILTVTEKTVETPSNPPQQNTSLQENISKKIEDNIPAPNNISQNTAASSETLENKPVTSPTVNTAKIEDTVQAKNITKGNFPIEDSSGQQPLKMENFSEASLNELNKSIVSLNNNVNNISNMLTNATNILATIASKENVTSINNIANSGGSSQPKQYQMITGGIEGYRQSYRTPNNPNDILGRTLTPNIPGVSYA
jgi:hypothetical protein